ncbi:MAG: hypothetical protein ABIJ37_07650 [Pseudomonadota bacterium]
MLIPFDDYPYHQIPSTFDHASDGDRRWTDRYWFVTCSPEGQLALATGLCLYKNMNVLDCFASAVIGKKQRNVRMSRALRPKYELIGAGPLRFEVMEGLRSFRLLLNENEYDLSYDLTWNAKFPPIEEGKGNIFMRSGGVLTQNLVRFFQHGAITGKITVDGKTFETGDKKWFAFRDRSFGIRPFIGGQNMPSPAPEKKKANQSSASAIAISLFCGFSSEDVSGYFRLGQKEDGTCAYFDGRLNYPLGDDRPEQKQLTMEDHKITLSPGIMRLEKFSVSFRSESGEKYRIEGEPLVEPFRYEGFGYLDGYQDKQGQGIFRGDDHIEGENYDLTNPEQTIDESGKCKFKPGIYLADDVAKLNINGKTGYAEVVVYPASITAKLVKRNT